MSSDFELELSRHFSGDLRFDPYSRILYSTDASSYQIEPIGVGPSARPSSSTSPNTSTAFLKLTPKSSGRSASRAWCATR
ncbi:MAG: hypothetical protein HYZ49_08260 [Chloroflexi bacterium]|nr:hypothetical protein [Chloroflexota bacterium]